MHGWWLDLESTPSIIHPHPPIHTAQSGCPNGILAIFPRLGHQISLTHRRSAGIPTHVGAVRRSASSLSAWTSRRSGSTKCKRRRVAIKSATKCVPRQRRGELPPSLYELQRKSRALPTLRRSHFVPHLVGYASSNCFVGTSRKGAAAFALRGYGVPLVGQVAPSVSLNREKRCPSIGGQAALPPHSK
jgi:hypothetical protein